MVRGPQPGGSGSLPGTYTVRAGDTWQRIAKSVYGDANRWRDLFQANLEVLAGPEMLYPGQQIRVPGRTPRAPTRKLELPQTPESEAKAARFVSNARRFVGQPFRWGGGHGPRPFDQPGPVDCSGLVAQAAQLAGLSLSGSASELQRLGREVPMTDLRAGDLVFQGIPALDVAISLGWGRVLHASRQRGKVIEADIAEAGRFDNARRVV